MIEKKKRERKRKGGWRWWKSHTQTQGNARILSVKMYYRHFVAKYFLFQLTIISFFWGTFFVSLLPSLLVRGRSLWAYYHLFLRKFFFIKLSPPLRAEVLLSSGFYHLFFCVKLRIQWPKCSGRNVLSQAAFWHWCLELTEFFCGVV